MNITLQIKNKTVYLNNECIGAQFYTKDDEISIRNVDYFSITLQ